MSIAEIIFPTIFMALGTAMAIFPNQAGLMFCRLGKATWKISTLGITDMHWFYPEDKAPRIMRRMGLLCATAGVIFAILLFVSISGPNSLAATREAKAYLEAAYGPSPGNWRLSCQPSSEEPNGVEIQYRYSDRKGALHGEWTGKRYTFTQVP